MNRTLFHICIVICLGLIVFNLGLGYLQSTNAFGSVSSIGDDTTTDEALAEYANLEESSMDYIWEIIFGAALAGLFVGWLTHSVVPIGLFVFSGVFWASFINTHHVLSIGGFIPGEILGIVTILSMFVFIGACVGMFTGSG